MQIVVTAKGEGRHALDNVRTRITLAPGEAFTLPTGFRRVSVVSGLLWLTHGPNDRFVWVGEVVQLPKRSAWRRWRDRFTGESAAAVLSPVGREAVEVECDGVLGAEAIWAESYRRQRREAMARFWTTCFWTMWRSKSGSRPRRAANLCA